MLYFVILLSLLVNGRYFHRHQSVWVAKRRENVRWRS